MKVFTGKELFDSHVALNKSLQELEHLTNGEIRCSHCGGTGWTKPPLKQVEVKVWPMGSVLRIGKALLLMAMLGFLGACGYSLYMFMLTQR